MIYIRPVQSHNFRSFEIFLTYRQSLRIIFHIRYFYVHLSSFPCIFLNSVYIYIFLPCPSDISSTLFICTNYVVSKVPKLCSLHWICHEISPHLICWTILDLNILFFNLICHEKVTNIQRLDSITCTPFIINLQHN